MAIKISLLINPQCSTKSAFDRNLKAKPSSKKPNIILNVFIHLPDFGKDFNIFGKRANTVKGSAKAIPKPSIPIESCRAPPCEDNDPTNKEPKIGPVQENETKTRVSAIKKIPIKPPILFDFESIELIQDEGMVIS